MGLLRMAARTAVVAGTATAVSGRVQRRQANKWDQQDQQQYEQQQYEQQQYDQQQYAQQQQQYAPPPAAPAEEDPTAQLAKYAKLHEQGVLTDEEFAATKAKILGI